MMKKGKIDPLKLGPYEWSRDGITKGWEFNPAVDENLIGLNPGEGTLYKVIRAYKRARDKIEGILDGLTAKLEKKKSAEYIPPANYEALRMDAILVRVAGVAGEKDHLRRLAFPVEMRAIVEVYRTANTKETYKVKIDLDSPFDGYNDEGPHGPHVGYEITGGGIRPITGHLLIDANLPKDPSNPCPQLLPDRYSIETDDVVPDGVDKISPERVLSGVKAFPGGANLNLWRVPMKDGDKDKHFKSNFYLASCTDYMGKEAKKLLPTVATFE